MSKSKDNLSRPYTLRLPRETAARFEQLAEDSGLGISAILRECLINSRPVFKQRMPVALKEERARVLLYVSKSSNNLNQIARALNTLDLKGELTHQNTLEYLYRLDNIEAQFIRALERFDVD